MSTITDDGEFEGDRYERLKQAAETYASGSKFGDNFITADMVRAFARDLTTARVLDGLTDHDSNTVSMLTVLDFPRGVPQLVWRLRDWTSRTRSVDRQDDDEFAVLSVLARILAMVSAAFVGIEFEIAQQHLDGSAK